MESMLDELYRMPHHSLLLVFDELVALLGVLGRYAPGGSGAGQAVGAAAADRGTALSLHSSARIQMGTKKDGVQALEEGTYSSPIVSSTQPAKIQSLLINKEAQEDGLLFRWLLVFVSALGDAGGA
jgi:hypothetical protein